MKLIDRSPAQLNDIGVWGKDGKELYLKKRRIVQSEARVELLVAEFPIEAGGDPL